MADWIFQSPEYTERYHQVFREFLDTVDPEAVISQAQALITPYVERDPTKFCTMEEFTAGVEALRTFCALRTESVSRQLEGSLSSTAQGREDSADLVDVSGLELSDMGGMEAGGPGRGVFRGETGEFPDSPQGPGERGGGAPFPAGGAPPG